VSDPIAAAIIATTGSIVVALITRQQIRRRVGTPNGRGNLIEMAERSEARLERLEDVAGQLVDGQARIVNSQAGQDRRLAVLERDRPPPWLPWVPVAVTAALVVLRRRFR